MNSCTVQYLNFAPYLSTVKSLVVVATSGAANGGPRGPGPPPKPHHKIFTDYKKYETCPVNRKVKSITGSVFVFVSREAAILAQNALETVWRLCPDPLWELTTALPQTP